MKEIAPSLWQLTLLPPNAINVYLAGDVLFDAATKWSHRRILKQLEGREVSKLALTHVHPDHQGSAKKICDTLSIPLACHPDDVDAMEGRAPFQKRAPNHPVNRLSKALYAGPPRNVDETFVEGDEVAGFRVVHAPGHSPGEVIFFRESDRVAVTGDVINTMNVATLMPGLHISPPFFTYDMNEAKRSIVKLLDLRPSLVCPGHGPPLRDISKLERFVEKHDLRSV